MDKKQIVRIGGIVSAVIFALGALFPIASVEFLGSKITVSLIDGSDWIFVILNALLCLVGFLLTEDVVVDTCGITAGFLAYGKLHAFFDDSAGEAAQFISKGVGFYCLLIGAVLMIVLGAVFTFMKDPDKKKEQKATKKCPFCAETIKADAIICRFCGSKLESDSKDSEKDDEDDDDDDEEPEEKLKRYAKKGGRFALTIMLGFASLVLCGFVIISVLNGGSLPIGSSNDNISVSEPISNNEVISVPDVEPEETVSTPEQTTTAAATTKATTTTTAAPEPEPEEVVDNSHPIEAYFLQNDNFASGAVEGAVPYIQLYSNGTFDFQCNKYSDVLTYTGTWEYMQSRWGFNFVLTVTDSNYGSASDEVKNTPITLSYFGENESAGISYASDGHSGVYGMTTPNSTFEVIYFNYLA